MAAALYNFIRHLSHVFTRQGMLFPFPCSFSRLIFALVLLGNLTCRSYAESAAVDTDLAYRIKAAYLYNLSKFITWPDEAKDAGTPITICLMGSNPFKDYIFKLEQRKARGRSIRIINQPAEDQRAGCDMMFFPVGDTQSASILSELKNPHLLTVGESDAFIQQGGMINLSLENDRVQLTINNTKAKQKGFTISANLLEIARQVE